MFGNTGRGPDGICGPIKDENADADGADKGNKVGKVNLSGADTANRDMVQSKNQ
jgi:hypothetical protein